MQRIETFMADDQDCEVDYGGYADPSEQLPQDRSWSSNSTGVPTQYGGGSPITPSRVLSYSWYHSVIDKNPTMESHNDFRSYEDLTPRDPRGNFMPYEPSVTPRDPRGNFERHRYPLRGYGRGGRGGVRGGRSGRGRRGGGKL